MGIFLFELLYYYIFKLEIFSIFFQPNGAFHHREVVAIRDFTTC